MFVAVWERIYFRIIELEWNLDITVFNFKDEGIMTNVTLSIN